MADAVIVDDGGSTRIKQVKSGGSSGKMNDLIDLQKDVARGPFAKITITCLNDEGTPVLPGGASATTFPLNLGSSGGQFVVVSGDHRVECLIVNGNDCLITVTGVNGTVPIIEGRHAKGQHRYVVSNAPPIEKIEVTAVGSSAKTFTVPNKTQYTAVVLT